MARQRLYTSDNPHAEAVRAYKANKKIVRVPLDMPEAEANALRQYCADNKLTVTGFIRGLIRDALAAAGRGK